MIARALKHKGVQEFIDAATILGKKYPDVSFQFVGSPDEGNRFSVTEKFMKAQTVYQLSRSTK